MRRSQRQILRLMLESARDGIKKTNMMFAAYINYKQLKPYLKILIAMELVRQHNSYYFTTGKGRRWLKAYNALRTIEEPADA